MADVTRTIHVLVQTFDPAQSKMVAVPNAMVLIEDSGLLWDPNLSDGNATTGADGKAQVDITFDETEENSLNPYFTITMAEADRNVPSSSPPERRLRLPEEWVTQHEVQRRIPRITEHTDPNKPLEILVGLYAKLRVSYSDFDSSGIRNPIALPEDTVRIYLADYDDFLWIDWLNPDDTLEGYGFDPKQNKTIPIGEEDEYPYFDTWPTAPSALDGLPESPQAWLDPPGMPVGSLGGGSFQSVGLLAVDVHGFVHMTDLDLTSVISVIRRFYPDGTLAETIPHPDAGFTFGAVAGLALDQYCNLFVADFSNHNIHVLRLAGLDGGSGRYELVGFVGPTTGVALSGPSGLAVVPNRVVDGEELLAITNVNTGQVQITRINVSKNLSPPVWPHLSLRASEPNIAVTLIPLTTFGSKGGGPDQFQSPVGVAADSDQRLYVCDSTLHRISRWTLNSAGTGYDHDVNWEKAGGGSGSGNREFDTPIAIAVDRTNNHVYVADSGNNRVQRFDAATGNHLANWTPAPTGSMNPFVPLGLAVDSRGELFASDNQNRRVVRGSLFNEAGEPLGDTVAPRLVGEPWTPIGEHPHMQSPRYVSFGPDGKLWVSDSGNNRVLAFQRDADGKLIPAPSPTDPSAPLIISGDLNNPVGVAVSEDGTVFVVDSDNHRIIPHNPGLVAQTPLGSGGSGDDEFEDPYGIAISPQTGLLYVADRFNNRVQVLQTDGTFTGRITTDSITALSFPEDVAVDAQGNIYVADTGNKRIVQFAEPHNLAYRREIKLNSHGMSFQEPCGVSVDDNGKLLVTDRAQNRVFLIDPQREAESLIAFWDLEVLLHKEQTTGLYLRPELRQLLPFDKPARAGVDATGLLAVADTGHDRVRLVRIHSNVELNLFELGGGLPDISFRAITQADWSADLGLELNVGDINIFDDSHSFASTPIFDYSAETYRHQEMLGPADSTNAAVHSMRIVRQAQRWYQQYTRQDEAEHRWGIPGSPRTLDIDLISGTRSYMFLDVNLALSKHGRHADAWHDGTIVHELSHWVFHRAAQPYLPYSIGGLISLSFGHSHSVITNFNQALSEGWSEYAESFWEDAESRSRDRIRGFRIENSYGLTGIKDRDGSAFNYLFGGPVSNPFPTFGTPGMGLQVEGYVANALYQLHQALLDPGVMFADSPSYWHRFNSPITDEQSQRYSDTIWRALRMFPLDPPQAELDQGSMIYLRNVLRSCRERQAAFHQIVQSIFELNNLLMPVITITAGTSETEPGTPVSDPLALTAGNAQPLIVRVTDAAGNPLAGYNLNIQLDDPAWVTFLSPPAEVAHGRVVPSGLNRATNEHGIVNFDFDAPLAVGMTKTVEVSYQPDFDTDATFAPPKKGDDREATLRKLYLYELRSAAKVWGGVGNNFGARVFKTLTIEIS